jgi:hypothetical protein
MWCVHSIFLPCRLSIILGCFFYRVVVVLWVYDMHVFKNLNAVNNFTIDLEPDQSNLYGVYITKYPISLQYEKIMLVGLQ